ncbi:DNA adenine methylase [Flavobacterium cheongpyeongense]|uniref:Site-specific DNA-methyltransferase (adenine-specific) n=1 Tax=Flavobacterium cheongpyeongense TaxID=2212651 RepID=A0A2V4BPJ2_9FLAO|nr:Dam family site-specific DNA-(adenine-N6)-methyltransferase [Flavobacterium cheongpyeongense]PXY40855.1 DNA adenine methylase [Flavobacterium cheongpyeongense]
MITQEKAVGKPFLRWAGGKRWLTSQIETIIPKDFNNYFEPFLGGASIYIYLKKNNLIKNNSFLSDANQDLINAYNMIAKDPQKVIDILKKYKNEKEQYYILRDLEPENDIEKAARFIYLNKTSYNGIYRVNRNGKYNVPYGDRKIINLFDFENIENVSKILNKETILISHDFELIKTQIQPLDLIFLDPPYTVAHENNGFVEYNQSIFTWDDQKRLANLLQHINEVGAFFIMTNAKHDSIDELFSPYGKHSILSRQSLIGGKGAKRQNINEYIFKNF